jgi:hypothetical protein
MWKETGMGGGRHVFVSGCQNKGVTTNGLILHLPEKTAAKTQQDAEISAV